MTNEEYKKLIESRGRKLAVKTEPFEFPKDDKGNRIEGWFINPEDGEVYFITPNIHGMGRLTLHSIDSNGEVNASVLVRGMGFNDKEEEYHEFVVLADWDKNYIKKAGKPNPELLEGKKGKK